MKALIRIIFFIGLPSVLILYAILRSLLNFLFHEDLIDPVKLTIESLIFALVFTLFQGLILIQFFKPKILFLKSDLPIEKRFGNVVVKINISGKQFDFESFVKLLKENFVITYSDKNKNIIKVRDKFRFWSWGAAAMINVDVQNNCLTISAFSFNGTNASGDKKSSRLIEEIKARAC